MHGVFARHQPAKPLTPGVRASVTPRVPRSRQCSTDDLFAGQSQGCGMIPRDRLSRRRREPKDCVVHGVVGLSGDPCVRLFIEELRILHLKVETPKSPPRLAKCSLDLGRPQRVKNSSLDPPSRRMGYDPVVYARRQTLGEPVQPPNRPRQVLEVVQVCAKGLRILGVREAKSHVPTVASVVAVPVQVGSARSLWVGEHVGGYVMLGHGGAATGRSARGDALG